jgi:hypothetical protein
MNTSSSKGMVTLTPAQSEVALAKLVDERQQQSGIDRFLRAGGQVLGRIALAAVLASLLFVREYGGIAVGLALMGLLLAVAQVAVSHLFEIERRVAGQGAAQRLGIRARVEAELAEIRSRTWYWIVLIPIYAWLLVGQWTGWPRPWWLYALGMVIFAKLLYDAIHARMAESDYYTSVVELEELLKVRQATGTTSLSEDQAHQLFVIEQHQTQRQVARALQQEDSIPLSAVEDELYSSIRDAHQANGEPPHKA